VTSILGRELLSSALAAVHGKVARVPAIYHGRSLGPSNSYANWHPLEWLITDPQGLGGEYGQYRRILSDHAGMVSGDRRSLADTERLVDLIHMQYLVRHAPAGLFDFMIGQTVAGAAPRAIFQSPQVTTALIEAANDYRPLQEKITAPVVIAAPPSAAPPSLVRRVARRLDRVAPGPMSVVRSVRNALRTRPKTVRLSDLPIAAPAAPTAPPGPLTALVETSTRRYALAEDFLSPSAAYGVAIEPGEVQALIAILDKYQ